MNPDSCSYCDNNFTKCHRIWNQPSPGRGIHIHTCPGHANYPAITVDILTLAQACIVQAIGQGRSSRPDPLLHKPITGRREE